MKLNSMLMIPLVSTKTKVWRESDFITYFQIAKMMPDVVVYFVVNKEAELPEEYCLPNIEYVKVGAWFPHAAAGAVISSEVYEKFNPLNGDTQVDLIFMSHSLVGAAMKRMMHFSPKCQIPIFLNEQKAADFGKTHDGVTDLDLLLRSITYAECTAFLGTAYEREIAVGAAKRYLSPSMLKKLDHGAIARSCGVPLKEINEQGRVEEKYDKFTLLFAARFNNNKRWEDVLGVMEMVCRAAGGHVQAKAICPSMPLDSATRISHFQLVEFNEALPRAEYVRMLCKSHLSISMSVEEGFSFGWSEQIATGHPVLLPRRKWAKGLMPHPEYDICFYQNELELRGLIDYMRVNYAEVCRQIEPAVEKFVGEHDLPRAVDEMRGYMERGLDGTFEEFKDWGPRLTEVLNLMPEKFTLEGFAKAAGKNGMYFGQQMRQLSTLSSYRNLYFWLKQRADLVKRYDSFFRKRVKV